MKRLMGGLVLAVACSLSAPAMAFSLPGSGGGDDAALVQVQKQNAVLLKKTHTATVKILDAVALWQKAAGNEAEVKRIHETAAKLGKVKQVDANALKAASAEVRALADRLAAAEYAPRKLSLDEKAWLDEALTTIGVAGLADAEVAKDAVALSAEVAKVGAKAATNPFALMKVKDETTAVQFVSGLAAEQAATAKTVQDAMLRFAASHELEPPTIEEIQKAYEALR